MYRIFIASPGGLADERRAFKHEVYDYNEAEAIQRGLSFFPIGWELTLGGVGRPQALINRDIEECDYFLLVLWDRWGSSPQVGTEGYTSGVEEEYHVALRCFEHHSKPMRQILVFFKAPDERQLSDPGPQLKKVLEFKRKLEEEKALLFETFDDAGTFTQKLRRYLAQWVRDHEQGKISKVVNPIPLPTGPPVDASETESELPESAPKKQTPKKEELTEEEIELANRVVAGDVKALQEYGALLSSTGRLARAQKVYERLLNISERTDNALLSAKTLTRLAALHDRAGEFRQSLALSTRALELLNGQNDPPPDEVFSVLIAVGGAELALAQYREAERHYRDALAIRRVQRNSFGTAFALHSLSGLFYVQTRYEEARGHAEEALSIRKKLGQDHIAYVNSARRVGTILRALGAYEKAEVLLQLSLDFSRKTSKNLSASLTAFGVLRKDQGRIPEALELLTEGMSLREKEYGASNLITSRSLGEVGDVYRLAKRTKEAEAAHKRSFDIRRRILGDEHPLTALAMLGIAELYIDQGGFSQALVLSEDATRIIVAAIEGEVPMTARARAVHALANAKLGRAAAAREEVILAHQTFIRTLGPEHPEVIRAASLERSIGRMKGI